MYHKLMESLARVDALDISVILGESFQSVGWLAVRQITDRQIIIGQAIFMAKSTSLVSAKLAAHLSSAG